MQWVAMRATEAPASYAWFRSWMVPRPGQQQHGDLRGLGLVDGGPDQVQFRGLGEAVVEGGAAQAVAVGDLDDLDAGVVEGADHGADMFAR